MTLIRLMVTIGFALLASTAGAETCVKDDTNHPVCIQHAQRVLVLAPHLTEIVDFAGGLGRVLAVDSASNFPPAVKSLPKIANPSMLGAEAILARKPDLVLVWQSGISMAVVAQLRKAGVPVYVSEPRSLQQVASTMRRVSELLGTAGQTNPKVDGWLLEFERLRSQYSRQKPVPVFYQVWSQPLMTLGGKHVVSEILGLCGGQNIFQNMESLAAQVSIEAVLKRKPAILMTSGSAGDHQLFQKQWAAWPQLPAVGQGQLHTLPNDILVRNGPRLLDAARRVCSTIAQAGKPAG